MRSALSNARCPVCRHFHYVDERQCCTRAFCRCAADPDSPLALDAMRERELLLELEQCLRENMSSYSVAIALYELDMARGLLHAQRPKEPPPLDPHRREARRRRRL